jgi:hypothetical protein
MSVMGVISGTFPHTYRVLYMTVNWWVLCERHGSVTLIVMDEKA